MEIKQELWVEEYRPKKISECILPKRIKDMFQGYVDKKEMPNLLLTGMQGTGKTSVAKALARELGAEMLYVDCSTENGKKMLVETVIPFASTVSMDNPQAKKVILMDECLEENETIRIGTVDNYQDVPLKMLTSNTEYPVVSFNMKTKEVENDTAILCADKEDELYEVTLSNGQTILCNANHPFVIEEDGSLIKKRLKDGIEGSLCYVIKTV